MSKGFVFCPYNFTLCCWSRRFHFNRRNNSTRKHNNDFTELEVKTATQLLWPPCASQLTAKKQVTVLAGVTDPDDQRASGQLLHNGGKEECLNIGDPLGYLLVLPCAVIKVNGKL